MKKLFMALISLVLICSLCVPALAFNDYNTVYDATELLDAETCQTVSEVLIDLDEQYAVHIQVDGVDDLEGDPIEDYARLFYEQYEYGHAGTGDCLYLMLYLTEDDTGLTFGDYYVLYGGENEAFLSGFVTVIYDRLDQWLNVEIWSDGIDEDNIAFAGAMQEFTTCADGFLSGVITEVETEPGAPASPSETQTPEIPSDAGDVQLGYITDAAGILTDAEWQSLEDKAEAISEKYQCAVYFVTVDDYTDYGSGDVYDVAKEIYRDYDLGWGAEKSGVLLLLSMADRDYALIANGYGNTAFTDYGKDKLSDEFLDDFGDNDWAGGLEDYLGKSAEMLTLARDGSPLDEGSDPAIKYWGVAIAVLLSCVLSFVVCFIFKANMESVVEKSEANAYVAQDSISFTAREDYFTHATETRTEIKKESSGGGTSVDSDGFSGKSGKF